MAALLGMLVCEKDTHEVLFVANIIKCFMMRLNKCGIIFSINLNIMESKLSIKIIHKNYQTSVLLNCTFIGKGTLKGMPYQTISPII